MKEKSSKQKNNLVDENHIYGMTNEEWDLLPEKEQDKYRFSDPDYWNMLFDFGRFLYERGDEDVKFLWKRNYDRYISSVVWKNKSEKIKSKRGNKCQVCGGENELQVHHNTYDRLGNEDDNDLVLLCKSCHFLFHRS